MLQPFIKFREIVELVTKRYQLITITVEEDFVTVTYMSPTGTAAEMREVLNVIIRHSGRESSIIGDFNERRQTCDDRDNHRGAQVYKWASKNIGDKYNGGTKLCHTKECQEARPYNQAISTTVTLHGAENREAGDQGIKKKIRRSKEIVWKAREELAHTLTPLLSEVRIYKRAGR